MVEPYDYGIQEDILILSFFKSKNAAGENRISQQRAERERQAKMMIPVTDDDDVFGWGDGGSNEREIENDREIGETAILMDSKAPEDVAKRILIRDTITLINLNGEVQVKCENFFDNILTVLERCTSQERGFILFDLIYKKLFKFGSLKDFNKLFLPSINKFDLLSKSMIEEPVSGPAPTVDNGSIIVSGFTAISNYITHASLVKEIPKAKSRVKADKIGNKDLFNAFMSFIGSLSSKEWEINTKGLLEHANIDYPEDLLESLKKNSIIRPGVKDGEFLSSGKVMNFIFGMAERVAVASVQEVKRDETADERAKRLKKQKDQKAASVAKGARAQADKFSTRDDDEHVKNYKGGKDDAFAEAEDGFM